jgi:hypothetical protein
MLHEAQTAIEKLRGDQKAKEDIVQEEVRRIVIDEDGDIEWEDVEHEADEEQIP